MEIIAHITFSANHFNCTEWLMPAIMSVAVLLVVFPLRMFSRIGKEKLRQEIDVEEGNTGALPGISVIVYTVGNATALQNLLAMLIRQDYNGDYEIIVTCDGESDAVADVVKIIGARFRNIRITFVPDKARNLSRRKLAVTLGIKAAKHDIVLLTHADAVVESESWITTFSRLFSKGCDIVLGTAVPVSFAGSGLGQTARKINAGITELTWLAAALCGKPFRGCGYNLAYRKHIFFDHNGFSKSLNLHFGDDDIFVREIAPGSISKVNLQPGSSVRIDWTSPDSMMKEYESRRVFTNRNAGRRWRMTASIAVVTAWIVTVAVIVQASLYYNSIIPLVSAIMLAIAYWVLLATRLKHNIRQIGIKVSAFEVIAGTLMRPFITIANRRRMRADIDTNFTWQMKR